jgi:hypothetical protein
MARPKKPEKQKTNVVQMEAEAGGNVAVAEKEPETPFDAAAEPEQSPPPESSRISPPPPETKRSLTFWQRVHAIPKADWGTRAFIYVYCLEPICDLRQGGEKKYLVRIQAPVEDENFLMADYGSGKYRLTLVHRKPAGDKADTMDTIDVEIYNPKYPPKIPRSVWMADRRNERWAALLPKEEPPVPPTGLGTITDAFDTFTKIQDNIRAQTPTAPPPLPPPDDVVKFKGMVDVVRSIMPQPAPATDNKILDTVIALMMKQIDTSQTETKELRQELREVLKERQTKPDGDGLESLIDKLGVLAPKLKDLLGLGGEKLTDVVHGRRRPWYEELAINAVPQLAPGINTLLGAAASYFLTPRGNGLGAVPAPNGAAAALPPANGQPPAPADPLEQLRQKVGGFLGANIMPLQKHFEAFVKGAPRDEKDPAEGIQDGSDFAFWVFDNFGPQILQDARALGSANITAMFKASPYWAAIAPEQAKFTQFLDQVLSFQPDEPEPGQEAKPVDLTAD